MILFIMVFFVIMDKTEMPFIPQENVIDGISNYQGKKNHWLLNRSAYLRFLNPNHNVMENRKLNHHHVKFKDDNYKNLRKRLKRSEYPRETIPFYPLKYRTLITNTRNQKPREYHYSLSESTQRDGFHNLHLLSERIKDNSKRKNNAGLELPSFTTNKTYAALFVTPKEMNSSSGQMYPPIRSGMTNSMKAFTASPVLPANSPKGFKIVNQDVRQSQQLQRQPTLVNGKEGNWRSIQLVQSPTSGNSLNLFSIPPLNNKRSQQTWRTFKEESKGDFQQKPISTDRYPSNVTARYSIKTNLNRNFFQLPIRGPRQMPNRNQNQQFRIPFDSGTGKVNNLGPPTMTFGNTSNPFSRLYPSYQNQESWQPFRETNFREPRGDSKQTLFLSGDNPFESVFNAKKKGPPTKTFKNTSTPFSQLYPSYQNQESWQPFKEDTKGGSKQTLFLSADNPSESVLNTNKKGPPTMTFKNTSNPFSGLYPSYQYQESWHPFKEDTRGSSKQTLFLSADNPSESVFNTNKKGPPTMTFKNTSNPNAFLGLYPSYQNQEFGQPFKGDTRVNSKQTLLLSADIPSESAFNTNKKADVNQTFFQLQFPGSDQRTFTDKVPNQFKSAEETNRMMLVPKENAQFQFLYPKLKTDTVFKNYPTVGQGHGPFFPSSNINKNKQIIWPHFEFETGGSVQQSPVSLAKPDAPFLNTNLNNQQYQLPVSGSKYHLNGGLVLNQPAQSSSLFVLPEGNNQPQIFNPSFVHGKGNTEPHPFMQQVGKYVFPQNFYPQVYPSSNEANPFLFNKPNLSGSVNSNFTNEYINTAVKGGLNQFSPFIPRNHPDSLGIDKEHQTNLSSTESSENQLNTTKSSLLQFLRRKFEGVRSMSKSNQILLGSLVILVLISFGVVAIVTSYKHHRKKTKHPPRNTILTLLKASKQE